MESEGIILFVTNRNPEMQIWNLIFLSLFIWNESFACSNIYSIYSILQATKLLFICTICHESYLCSHASYLFTYLVYLTICIYLGFFSSCSSIIAFSQITQKIHIGHMRQKKKKRTGANYNLISLCLKYCIRHIAYASSVLSHQKGNIPMVLMKFNAQRRQLICSMLCSCHILESGCDQNLSGIKVHTSHCLKEALVISWDFFVVVVQNITQCCSSSRSYSQYFIYF